LDNERISLRLDVEDLELIDEFVAKHPEFSNRSHLARIALRNYIERDAGIQTKSTNDRAAVKIPGAIKGIIDKMVEDGYYSSVDAAVEDALREQFLPRTKMQEVKESVFEETKKAISHM
jgi:Arc/MetJ-type ribon-helix-helix transcriptional regulator